jgi:hypothetical protein
MAIGGDYGPPLIDFSSLARMGEDIGAGLAGRRRQEILSKVPRGMPPLAALGAALIEAGDTNGALAVARLAQSQAENSFDRQYKAGMLGIAQQQANRREAPTLAEVYGPDGRPRKVLIEPSKGLAGVTPIGGSKGPETPPLQAGEKKAIFDAEDEVPNLKGTIETLTRARDLNDQTFTGYTAGTRGSLGSKLPGWMVPDSVEGAAKATNEWQNLMGGEALTVMANSLKGATTNFELQEFQKRLADPTTPPDTRKRIINRMLTLAERKLEINNARIRDLKGGDYFKPGGAKSGGSSEGIPTDRPDGVYYSPSTKTKYRVKGGRAFVE